MQFPMIKANDSWLDVVMKAVVVAGVCCALLAYVTTIRPAFKTYQAMIDAENRVQMARQGLKEMENDVTDRREMLSALDNELRKKQKELSWLEVSLEKKAVEKTFLEEELAELEARFTGVKEEAIRAYLLKLTGDAIQVSVQQESKDGLKPGGTSFNLREHVIRVSSDTCRVSQEGSYRFMAGKLFEQFALEKLPEKGSSWKDLVAIVNWYPVRLPAAGPEMARGG